MIGLLELAGVVGLLIGTTVAAIGVAAAIGLILLMIGAITTRVRVHDSATMVLGDVAVLALVVVYLLVR